jgi:hypothetical protein
MGDFITRERFVAAESFALLNPPSWTRLEPVTATGDPRPGLEARVHDPLWMLVRQWQLGEFAGEDAGTPLTVRVVTTTSRVDRWADAAGIVHALDPGKLELLQSWVEREPVRPDTRGPGVRARIEAASVLMASLGDADLTPHRDAFVAQCAMNFEDALAHPDGEHAVLDPEWARLRRLLGARATADAERIAVALEGAAPGLPAWLVPADDADRDALSEVLAAWLAWYRSEVSPLPGGGDCWVDARLEYAFRVAVGDQAYDAPTHRGGDIDWHNFDPSATPVPLEEGAQAPPAPERKVHALLASPLRYPGMPADRYWEMEDSQVNLGLIEAEPWDLARLLVAEFALIYGNDWLVVPIDVPWGSLTKVESVFYTTAFGERFVVKPTADVSPDGRWQMFVHVDPAGRGVDGLLLPPAAVAVQDGPAIEDALFLRDEMANLCWCVERSVQGPAGSARNRAQERDDPAPFGTGPVLGAQLDYQLQSGVPARWIPYVPIAAGYRAVQLVQGAMPDASGQPVLPLGRLLNSQAIRRLADAEIPREGIKIERRPAVTRRADGTYVRWISRRVTVGRGEGSSRLAFDSAIPRKPRPAA